MNFKPLGERVLFKRTEVRKKTARLFYWIHAKEKPNTAEVKQLVIKLLKIKSWWYNCFEQYRGSWI